MLEVEMKAAYKHHCHMKNTTHLWPWAVCIHCVYFVFNTRAKSAAPFYNKSENVFTQFNVSIARGDLLCSSQLLDAYIHGLVDIPSSCVWRGELHKKSIPCFKELVKAPNF